MTEQKKPLVNLNYTEKDGIQYPNLTISNDSKDDQPLGLYGRMALEYLQAEHPQRYMTLKMDCSLMSVMHKVQDEATEKIESLIQQMLLKAPMPDTEDIMARTRHLNSLRSEAEAAIVRDLVVIPR